MLENLLEYLGFNNRYSLEIDDIPKEFHPGKTASIYVDDILVGYIGEINPNIIKDEVYVLELNIDKLFTLKVRKIKYKEISKYPTTRKGCIIYI